MVLMDSNVILDVATADLRWADWRCLPLLTRDERRYRQAFPGLELISP